MKNEKLIHPQPKLSVSGSGLLGNEVKKIIWRIENMDLKMEKFPKCPKCKNDMVPLSEPRERLGVKDYCLLLAEWKCVKCKHSVRHRGEMK